MMKLIAILAFGFMTFAQAEALSVFETSPNSQATVELNGQQMQATQGSGFGIGFCKAGTPNCGNKGGGISLGRPLKTKGFFG